MTLKTVVFDSTGKASKPEGWFSWRHRTREAHETARDAYLAEHGPEARRRKAREREPLAIDVHTFKCGHRSRSIVHPCGVAR